MVTMLEAVLLGSAVAMAVIVTLFPGGIERAEKVVAPPLTVWVGLKEPQLELPQVDVQSTPAPDGSLDTVALTVVVLPSCSVAGGGPVSWMVIGGAMITIFAMAKAVGSAVD
jgi:hypothetical protein